MVNVNNNGPSRAFQCFPVHLGSKPPSKLLRINWRTIQSPAGHWRKANLNRRKKVMSSSNGTLYSLRQSNRRSKVKHHLTRTHWVVYLDQRADKNFLRCELKTQSLTFRIPKQMDVLFGECFNICTLFASNTRNCTSATVLLINIGNSIIRRKSKFFVAGSTTQH